MNEPKFKKRIEAIFSRHEISTDYLENPQGRHPDQGHCPWVEFGLQNSDSNDGLSLHELQALAALLGTSDIEVLTQFANQSQGSFARGPYFWVTASNVNFDEGVHVDPLIQDLKKKREHAVKELLPKAKSNSEVRRIAVTYGLDPLAMVKQFGKKCH